MTKTKQGFCLFFGMQSCYLKKTPSILSNQQTLTGCAGGEITTLCEKCGCMFWLGGVFSILNKYGKVTEH